MWPGLAGPGRLVPLDEGVEVLVSFLAPSVAFEPQGIGHGVDFALTMRAGTDQAVASDERVDNNEVLAGNDRKRCQWHGCTPVHKYIIY